jgi:hypothetical protein
LLYLTPSIDLLPENLDAIGIDDSHLMIRPRFVFGDVLGIPMV